MVTVERVRLIRDLYISGATLRLREISEAGKDPVFKLTQKLPAPGAGARQGWITTMYVAAEEYRLIAQLPGKALTKTRFSVPPFGVDVFQGELEALCLAEAEFESAEQADALTIPSWVLAEATDDRRFTGGELAQTSRERLRAALAEYGIALESGAAGVALQ